MTAPTTPSPMRLADALRLYRADFDRWVEWLGGGTRAQKLYWFFLPTLQALFWYRICRYLYLKGWRNAARLVALFNLYLTRIEIPPTSEIGPGCVITHPQGVVICGRIGARCTISGNGGIGGGAKEGDVGGGPGLPNVGDDVFFGMNSGVFGAVRVGNGVQLGACTLTLTDVPAHATVISPTAVEAPTTPDEPPAQPFIAPAPIAMNDDAPLTFQDTRALIRSDAQRMFTANQGGSLPQRLFWMLMPTFQCLLWYRLSRYAYLRGWRNTARLLFLLNLYLTRVEIPPTTALGAACLIAHASGVVLYGRIGANATIFGDAKIGGGIDQSKDIGGGPGYPVLGDNVVLGYRATILGPFTVGDGAQLGPFSLATFEVAAGARLQTRRSVIMRAEAPPAVAPTTENTPS